MERLSQDLNLALEESSCERPDWWRVGLRRRTLSAGNLPAAIAVTVLEDGNSSSPPQAPLITQPLSDSDDPHTTPSHIAANHKVRYSTVGNIESDSINENFSPTRAPNAKRKRKYKKTTTDYADGSHTPPVEIVSVSPQTQHQSLSPGSMNKHSKYVKDRNAISVKRKWSQREEGDWSELRSRERSFSSGCSSKSTLLSSYAKSKDKKKVLQPGKIILKTQNKEDLMSKPLNFTNTLSLPGSSKFNFVYKTKSKNGPPQLAKRTVTGFKISTDLPPFFNNLPCSTRSGFDRHHHHRRGKKHVSDTLRDPLNFDDSNSGMDCIGNESSSLSSSDSDGVVTNDSDREGDDELTDWPGIEDLKVFNKSLTIKSSTPRKVMPTNPPAKRMKKEKFLSSAYSHGVRASCCKNRNKKKRVKVDSGNDDDGVITDSFSVIHFDLPGRVVAPPATLSSFSDVKNAGPQGQYADETFYQSFQAYQENECNEQLDINRTPREDYFLQKTSSSDLNLSERSPQSESSIKVSPIVIMSNKVREIRAGCRRIRGERPGFVIQSPMNEQLARFLQDPDQIQLIVPALADPVEYQKLESFAKLYSLELSTQGGRIVITKTSDTTQSIVVESCQSSFCMESKRRCYGEETEETEEADEVEEGCDAAGEGVEGGSSPADWRAWRPEHAALLDDDLDDLDTKPI